MNEMSVGADMLVRDGGAIKALGNGRVGGYLALFTGPDQPDLQGDYFTKTTDFSIDNGDQRPIYYRHGVHPLIKSQRIGKATLTVDDVGVFVDGEIDLRNKYIRALYMRAEQKKDEPFLGWSSGALAHMVDRQPVQNSKVKEIVCWPIGEASLTPCPVEPRTVALPIKEWLMGDEFDLEQIVKSVDQDEYDLQFSIDGIPAIREFCEAVSPTSMKSGSERSEAAVNATKEFNTVGKLLGEGFHSYASRLVRRTENRFLKEGREVHPATVQQVNQLLSEIGRIEFAFSSVKEALSGLKRISEMTIAEQKALDERARSEMMNFCRISGLTPEELENAGTSTG